MLKPVHATLYLDYKCPSCASIHQITQKEAQQIGKVLCNCNRILKIAPFKARLNMEYKLQEIKVKKEEKPKREPQVQYAGRLSRNDVVFALVDLGWSRGEAKRIIASIEDGVMSDETLLQKCLRKKSNV